MGQQPSEPGPDWSLTKQHLNPFAVDTHIHEGSQAHVWSVHEGVECYVFVMTVDVTGLAKKATSEKLGIQCHIDIDIELVRRWHLVTIKAEGFAT